MILNKYVYLAPIEKKFEYLALVYLEVLKSAFFSRY